MPPEDLALFYISCVRSVNLSITWYQFSAFFCHSTFKKELVGLEKRVISIILSGIDYRTGLNKLDIKPIRDHHKHLCSKLFEFIKSDLGHKIHNLLPTKHEGTNNLKRKPISNIPRTHINRAKNSFILAMCMLLDLFHPIALVVYISLSYL